MVTPKIWATENVGVENVMWAKLRGLKTWEYMVGVENAGLEKSEAVGLHSIVQLVHVRIHKPHDP